MSKVATKKTAGILGDDLAVNAEKASGFQSSRELPVLWKITKGSFLNKLIILPLAFLLSAFCPKVIVPILLIGGIYLSFEGAEKIHHFLFHRNLKKESTNLKPLSEAEIQSIEKKKIKSAFPEIMIPLVSTEAEIKIMKELVIRIASEVQKQYKLKIEFMVGTMIELPRAAIKAKEIAKHAEFFSFGTNDLTQTTFGISRDDSGKFLNDYLDNKIFSIDPFVSIDDGVADLVEIAVEKGKSQNKKLKLGICGEHGGDPKSIEFCSKAGLNYVSCSPYRVPIARLAAAQAELKEIK